MNPNTIETCDELDNDCDGSLTKGSKTHFISMQTEMVLVLIRRVYLPVKYQKDMQTTALIVMMFCQSSIPMQKRSCDDLDNDCDGASDEGLNQIFYTDADSDGYGDPTTTVEDCELTGDLVDNNDDCDDTEFDLSFQK